MPDLLFVVAGVLIVVVVDTANLSTLDYFVKTDSFEKMAAMISNDILDIGSSKNRRRANGFLAPQGLTLGRPGQFDLPNVSDVRSLIASRDHLRRRNHDAIGKTVNSPPDLISHFSALIPFMSGVFCSRLCFVAATLPPCAVLVIPIRLSSLPRVPPPLPLNSRRELLSVSTLVPPWEVTLHQERSKRSLKSTST